MKRLGWLASIGFVLLSSVAQAQLNGPVPAPFTAHVFSVPGVVNFGGIGTVLACTNAGSLSASVGVEVFGPAGGAGINNPATTAVSLAPGATVLFGTVAFAGFSIDTNLATGVVSKGSARVLATTRKGILCSAFLADTVSNPPTSMTKLSVVKKIAQKGQ